MQIQFAQGYRQGVGYAPITATGKQLDYIQRCKETFAKSLRKERVARIGDKRVVRFLRKDSRTSSKRLAKQQERVLHAFENAMDIEPLATVEYVSYERPSRTWNNWSGQLMVENKYTEHYFLYTVSVAWRKNLPLAHILALIARNYYPADRRVDWRSILKWLRESRVVGEQVKKTMAEIINADGKIERGITNNGISDYTRKLAAKRKAERG